MSAFGRARGFADPRPVNLRRSAFWKPNRSAFVSAAALAGPRFSSKEDECTERFFEWLVDCFAAHFHSSSADTNTRQPLICRWIPMNGSVFMNDKWTGVQLCVPSLPTEHLDVVECGVILQRGQLLETQLLASPVEAVGAVNADVVVVAPGPVLHGAQPRRALWAGGGRQQIWAFLHIFLPHLGTLFLEPLKQQR